MGSKKGNTNIDKVFKGSTPIDKVFKGSTEIYSSGISFELGSISYGGKGDINFDPTSVTFSLDGTKMHVGQEVANRIYQFTLSTPFDVRTLSYDNLYISARGQITDHVFSPDGLELYITDKGHNDINQYFLSTPFDLSTADYDGVFLPEISGPNVNDPWAVTTNNDGTKFYIGDAASNRIYEYDVPDDRFGIRNASYVRRVSLGYDFHQGIRFTPDGTKLFVLEQQTLYQYSVSTPFDLSTLINDNVSYTFTQESFGRGFTFNNDGSKIYYVGFNGRRIHQYNNNF